MIICLMWYFFMKSILRWAKTLMYSWFPVNRPRPFHDLGDFLLPFDRHEVKSPDTLHVFQNRSASPSKSSGPKNQPEGTAVQHCRHLAAPDRYSDQSLHVHRLLKAMVYWKCFRAQCVLTLLWRRFSIDYLQSGCKIPPHDSSMRIGNGIKKWVTVTARPRAMKRKTAAAANSGSLLYLRAFI